LYNPTIDRDLKSYELKTVADGYLIICLHNTHTSTICCRANSRL